MDTPDPDFCGKSAEELQKEGRDIRAWGGFVFHVHPAQVPIMVDYQIPHIVMEQIPKVPEDAEGALPRERSSSESDGTFRDRHELSFPPRPQRFRLLRAVGTSLLGLLTLRQWGRDRRTRAD